MAKLRLGIDVGGTFTDFALFDGEGNHWILKVPTNPRDPADAIVAGIKSLLHNSNHVPAEIEHFVHGTTLALNTVLQRSGAAVGFVVTEGFEDLLEIGRARLPVPNNVYADKYPPIVRRELVRGIRERLLRDGTVHKTLDLDQLLAQVQDLVAAGAQAIVVCFLHSYRNSDHERRAREAIQTEFPGLYVCATTDLWSVQREYERATLATINAHVGERMRRYFTGLAQRIHSEGIPATVFSTKSNGGVMSAETAAERPVDTLLSGPAAGVIGAAHLGQRSGFSKLVGLDIGGTSADISIIDQEFGYTTETRVGDFPIITPAVEVTSIGAGGGSIAWVDQHGVLKVGPESAGADPGPACYGRGGNRPTVTDAYVANGWIDPEQFLAGTLKLQTHLGTRALSELGSGIGLDATELADAILTVTTSNMYAHIMPLLARAGVDLGEFALLAYGGAGPTHGFSLAKEIGISTVIVPPDPGTLCALGCLVADLRGDFMRTVLRGCAELTQGQVERWFVELETEADRWLKRQNATVEKVDLLRYAEMRYQGQSFEIEVPMTGVRVDDRELLDLRERFNDTYLRVYKTSDSNVPVEIVNLRVQVVGRTPKPTLKSASVAAERRIQSNQQRSIRIGSQSVKVDVYARTSLQPGDFFSSPCVVEQYDTTSVIPPGFSVSVDALGTMIARQG